MNLCVYLQGLREKQMKDEPPPVTWIDIKDIAKEVRLLHIEFNELKRITDTLAKENARLKVLLEDISHEVSKELTHKPTTRRKS